MKIHIDALMDYLACPQLYKYRHIQKVDASLTYAGRANRHSIVEAYDKALHKTIASMFHRIQDGYLPDLRLLKLKWGYLWVKPRSDQEDIRFKETSWRDVHDEKRKQGWKRLCEVFEHYNTTGWGMPVMVDFDYTIPIGAHTLEGRIDLVRVVKNKHGREFIEMTEFLVDERYAPFVHLRRDWRVTAASYAFRKLMNVKEEKIVYHGIVSGKLIETERTEEDYRQLEHLLDKIEKACEENIFYPEFGERCLSCPYEKHCEKGWYIDAEDQERER